MCITHTHTNTRTHTYTNTHTHTQTHAHTHTQTHTHTEPTSIIVGDSDGENCSRGGRCLQDGGGIGGGVENGVVVVGVCDGYTHGNVGGFLVARACRVVCCTNLLPGFTSKVTSLSQTCRDASLSPMPVCLRCQSVSDL